MAEKLKSANSNSEQGSEWSNLSEGAGNKQGSKEPHSPEDVNNKQDPKESSSPEGASSEQDSKGLRFPEDPNQYSEEELMADPAKRFHANPADFPIFSKQSEKGPIWGDPYETLPLDFTLGRFVKCTADSIAIIAGEDNGFESVGGGFPAADHVIYLDKSARPVSWLVNVFWDAFTNKPRPKHSYLAIDREEWFPRTGTKIDSNGYLEGTKTLATFSDFKKENVTDKDIACIRALFIPGGVEGVFMPGDDEKKEKDDIEKIMNTPIGLEGKNITIIDEVQRSGSTMGIAQYLINRVIPEAASVNGYTFWDTSFQNDSKSGEQQMRSSPVWYNDKSIYGRAIGDVNESFFAERYEKNPNPKTFTQKLGSFVLGEFINLSNEPGNISRQLAKEIKLMRKEYDAGHIMMQIPAHYDAMKWAARLARLGVKFVPIDSKPPIGLKPPKNTYPEVLREIENRKPIS